MYQVTIGQTVYSEDHGGEGKVIGSNMEHGCRIYMVKWSKKGIGIKYHPAHEVLNFHSTKATTPPVISGDK